MSEAAKNLDSRTFVRSLNSLMKTARLYEFEHARTQAQLETAWKELAAAVRGNPETGVLLSAIGTKLLLDGVPLDLGAPGRAFAQLFSRAGIASVHFLPQVTQEELCRFVRAFPQGNAHPEILLEKLKASLGKANGIQINEVRFIREDSVSADSKMASQLMMQALGGDVSEVRAWFDDPQKLLQLILAAESSRKGADGTESAGGAPGPRSGQNGSRGANAATGKGISRGATGVLVSSEKSEQAMSRTEAGEIEPILGLLKAVARRTREAGDKPATELFQQGVSNLPATSQQSIHAALAEFISQEPDSKADQPTILDLAERLAVQFALDRVESGDMRAGAVHQMLGRMSTELESLREILVSHEEKLQQAGIAVESFTQTLSTGVWSQVSDEQMLSALTAEEAWCCPPKVIRQFIQKLLRQGEKGTANLILHNYTACIDGREQENRRSTAIGLAELADLYVEGDGRALEDAVSRTGSRLSVERDQQLQALMSAAFARLTQEASANHRFPAILRALDLLHAADEQRPGLIQSLGPKLGVEERLPNYIQGIAISWRIPEGLTEVLRRMPQRAAQTLAVQFGQCNFQEECETLLEVAQSLGTPGLSCFREALRTGSATEAIDAVALLSRLDLAALDKILPARLRENGIRRPTTSWCAASPPEDRPSAAGFYRTSSRYSIRPYNRSLWMRRE